MALKISTINLSGGNYVVRSASNFSVTPGLLNLLCNSSNTVESALSSSSGFGVPLRRGP